MPLRPAAFSVRARVSPNPIDNGNHPTLYASTSAGAVCTARVVYSTGRPPRSFHGVPRLVGRSGMVQWTWHMESRGITGTALVTCTLGGQTRSAVATFSVLGARR